MSYFQRKWELEEAQRRENIKKFWLNVERYPDMMPMSGTNKSYGSESISTNITLAIAFCICIFVILFTLNITVTSYRSSPEYIKEKTEIYEQEHKTELLILEDLFSGTWKSNCTHDEEYITFYRVGYRWLTLQVKEPYDYQIYILSNTHCSIMFWKQQFCFRKEYIEGIFVPKAGNKIERIDFKNGISWERVK